MLVQITFEGKTYLVAVQPGWVDSIEELGGGGLLETDDPRYDVIAQLALDAIEAE